MTRDLSQQGQDTTELADALRQCRADLAKEREESRHWRQACTRWQRMVDFSPQELYLVRKDGSFAYVNPAAAHSLGYRPDELMHLGVQGIDAAYGPRFAEHLEALRAAPVPPFTTVHTSKDGTPRIKRMHSVYMQIDGQDFVCGFAVDVTQEKQVEEALRRSEQRFREVVDFAVDGILLGDHNGYLTLVNDRIVEILGIARDELLGKHISQAPFTAAALAAKPFRFDLVRAGQIVVNERELVRSDGAIVVVEMRSRMMPDGTFQSILRDITERKREQVALAASEGKVQRAQNFAQVLLDTSPAFIVAIGRDGATEMMNRCFLQALDYGDEEVRGLPYVETFVHPDDRERVAFYLKHLASMRQPQVSENRVVAKNGQVMQVEWHACTGVLGDSAAEIILGVGIDLAERKEAERLHGEILQQLAQAQKLESVGRLAGGVAHDFNNMLGVIIGHTELALDEIPEEHPAHSDLEGIYVAAQRSAELTGQLLTFARRQKSSPKVINLNAVVSGMHRMLRRIIGEHIDLRWSPGQDLGWVEIDPSQVDQILANLCVNARDAIHEAGWVHIETQNIQLEQSLVQEEGMVPAGDYVLLAVSDSGCGISEEQRPLIFEPFYTTKAKGQGTGLGLATVYGVVKQNHGYITFTSQVGKGTTFKLYFPRRAVPGVDGLDLSHPCPARQGSGVVLVVEDEVSLLALAARLLRNLGYRVETATGPAQALAMIDSLELVDLLLTDVIMPEMNGRELATRFRARFPQMQVLFMSGYTDNVISQRESEDGSIHFLQKPFTGPDLAQRVRRVLGQD